MRYPISREAVNEALAEACPGDSLEEYDETIIGLVHDGSGWMVLEDSLEDEAEAHAWADRAHGYGERVGLYQHTT